MPAFLYIEEQSRPLSPLRFMLTIVVNCEHPSNIEITVSGYEGNVLNCTVLKFVHP
jgi:hypothetical protein